MRTKMEFHTEWANIEPTDPEDFQIRAEDAGEPEPGEAGLATVDSVPDQPKWFVAGM
jgi:hypothetical protein